jgi:hypothetical protein
MCTRIHFTAIEKNEPFLTQRFVLAGSSRTWERGLGPG